MSNLFNEMMEEISEKDQRIADLEAKLAESEKQYQEYRQIVEKDIEKELNERIRDTIKEFNLDISQLKQQLAEKDSEIEELNYRLDLKFVNYTNNEAIKWLDNETAITKFEKVKDFVVKSDIPTERKTLTVRFINQQIKELKGER